MARSERFNVLLGSDYIVVYSDILELYALDLICAALAAMRSQKMCYFKKVFQNCL